MPSKFRESLGFVKGMISENPIRTKNEDEFTKEFVEIPTFFITKDIFMDYNRSPATYLYLSNSLRTEFYINLFNSFKFIYEIELILDQIEYDGMNLECTEALMTLCSFLLSTSTNVMIDIDRDSGFSFEKKYSLFFDVYDMATSMYNTAKLTIHYPTTEIAHSDINRLTQYDEIDSRLCCKYIRNGITVVKLFHILVLLQVTPLYSEGVHQISKILIQQLRDILFDKRIIKLVIDSDTHGVNPKPHKSTRLKIIFSMGNSDRYCIRLDFPHEGENSIHLNLNEPAHKQSTGLPFNSDKYTEALRICKDKSLFDKLFYYRDDLFWFRSDFSSQIKAIENDDNQRESLKAFLHERAHIAISSSDKENLNAVTLFSEALAEAIIDYENHSIYGETDSDDNNLYQYILFQDFIFDTVIKIRTNCLLFHIGDKIYSHYDDYYELENNLIDLFRKYIKEKFPYDKELLRLCALEIDLPTFFSKCLDYLDQMGI